jgi:nickel-dependent lactate racemase
MSESELDLMFPGVDHALFAVHDWRRDIVILGIVPAAFIEEVSEGLCSWDWEAQVNRRIASGEHDLIISIGQVVPHEVIGMANYSKNIFIGTGGSEGIHKSHYLGAVYGMERLMVRTDSPVRAVLDYAQEHVASHLSIEYVLTVMKNGEAWPVPAGLFMGADRACFEAASTLSSELNIIRLNASPQTVVVYLDPAEYRSTWLGNKSIYRTRMAIADDGRLIILAPGMKTFGEDMEIDRIIRRFGYRGTEAVMKDIEEGGMLSGNLAAAAHLIHGSGEGRFSITCCPGHLTREEIELVGYGWGNLEKMTEFYRISSLKEGWNRDAGGSSFFYITNPAAGLWIGPDKRSIT